MIHNWKLKVVLIMQLFFFCGLIFSKQIKLDERRANSTEWGYRPASGSVSRTTPPSFSWRPQKGLKWEIQCSRDPQFKKIIYHAEDLRINVHCPARSFEPGTYTWRYRGKDSRGNLTNWSTERTFSIAANAVKMVLPSRKELLSRIPAGHPRLFLRPENLPHLRKLAKGNLKEEYSVLVKSSEKLLRSPPSSQEPPLYPKGIVRGSDSWRSIWWGNRRRVIKALNGSATLGFTWLLSGRKEFGIMAKEILLDCAKWNPKGSTGYRYNDEAGMPYAYYFSRTYTFINSLLSEKEKKICREVMKIRGEEMYKHLFPRHFWRPYSSHNNRAWHFLGEIGIAFYNEIKGADDWVWFAANVFFNTYPVWCDDDGGWHEGSSYWSSYQNRFTWWADVMREALRIDAYKKPYYSKVGYYAMYLMPPNKKGGGFGDLTASRVSSDFTPLMTTFAAQAQNGYWQWWVKENGGPRNQSGYIGFIRGALPEVKPISPVNLPTSRLFKGTGQAFLNSSLLDAKRGVQITFKSSPFGTQSHGYEANNSFLLSGYGKRLLIRTGKRDSYGSNHHRNWMWSTRSVNNILVNGFGQKIHTSKAYGEITGFKTTPEFDLVSGEVSNNYQYSGKEQKTGSRLNHFTRTIIFAKPDLVIIFDRLKAEKSSTFDYLLHAVNKFKIKNQHNISVQNGDVLCDINFLHPLDLSFQQTNQYDPNPRPRIKLREWHLTGSTVNKQKNLEFITAYRIHRIGHEVPKQIKLKVLKAGYFLNAKFSRGEIECLLPVYNNSTLKHGEFTTRGSVKVRVRGRSKKRAVQGS